MRRGGWLVFVIFVFLCGVEAILTTCLLAVTGEAGKSRRGCIEVPGKPAGRTCLTTLSSNRLLHLGVVAEYFHLASCCSCCNCQTGNDAVGGFAGTGIDDA